MQSVTFSKSASQPFIYQYNLGFLIFNDRMIYNANFAAKSDLEIAQLQRITEVSNLKQKTSMQVSLTPHNIITEMGKISYLSEQYQKGLKILDPKPRDGYDKI